MQVRESLTLNNGVSIPMVGLGVFQVGNDITANVVKWALDAGYRHIDTATIYRNEEGVGQGIKDSSVPREEIFITSKVWPSDIRAGKTEEAFNASLKLLGTDYLDLYLLHWPTDGIVEAWKTMERLYKDGRIRAIGVSNFKLPHIETLHRMCDISPAINQIEIRPHFTQEHLVNYCQKLGIQIESWRCLGGTGGTLLEDPTLNEIAAKYGRSVAQIALRWNLQRGLIVLPKSTHKERIEANIKVFDFELSDEDMAKISKLNTGKREGGDPDCVPY